LQGEQFEAQAQAFRDGELDTASFTESERALLDFVATVTRHAYRVTDEQVQGLRDVGWSDAQIAEAVYVTALFSFLVRLADAFDIHPLPQYEPSGRPKASMPEAPSP
jgi:alkylhydroperoxidase family enzyme